MPLLRVPRTLRNMRELILITAWVTAFVHWTVVDGFPNPSTPPTNFLSSNAASLTDLLSSPERYARSLNMTKEQVLQHTCAHEEARQELVECLQSDDLTGPQKHALTCQHRLKYGRNPFVCPNCWSYLPVCICGLVGDSKIPLPENLSVIVWTHHREWGLTSNTGGLLGLMLGNCQLLMKGLPEHDILLDGILNNPENQVVVLWPDQKNAQENPSPDPRRSITLAQVQEDVRQKRKVVVVAVDGTWRNARRMMARLPRDKMHLLDLPAGVVFDPILSSEDDSIRIRSNGKAGTKISLLTPLRARGPNIGDSQVCTAEAVTGALLQLGLDEASSNHILSVTRRKVDLICRYRGKVSR